MSRTLVAGDIHGGLRALKQVLIKCDLRSDDKLIFLGDYVDGWGQSSGVVDFLQELDAANHCVFIKGNHDVWTESWLKDGKADEVWLAKGGRATIESYNGATNEIKMQHLKFFEQMPFFHTDEQNRLFIHAGYASMHGPANEMFNTNFKRDRTLWETALSLDPQLEKDHIFYPRRLRLFNEIFIGHTPTLNFNTSIPMNRANVWNLDTGAAFNGCLSIMDIVSKEYWQSSPLPKLYPHENGRRR